MSERTLVEIKQMMSGPPYNLDEPDNICQAFKDGFDYGTDKCDPHDCPKK